MKLYKCLPKEFHPDNGCTTIRLGTVEEFRVNYNGVGLINDWHEQIGSFHDEFNQNLFMRWKIPNCYIFCVTQSDNPDIAKDFDAGYDSFYEIGEPVQFARKIANLLLQQLNLTDLVAQQYIVANYSIQDLKGFAIRSLQGPIIYDDVKPILASPLISALFWKEKRFAAQKEYRFAFTVVNNGLVFDVKREAKLIETKPPQPPQRKRSGMSRSIIG